MEKKVKESVKTCEEYVIAELQRLKIENESLKQQNSLLTTVKEALSDKLLFLTEMIKKYGNPVDDSSDTLSIYMSCYSFESDKEKIKEFTELKKYFPIKIKEEDKESE